MLNCLATCLAHGATALADDALAAAQLELYLACRAAGSLERAWKSAPIRPRSAWLRESWQRLNDDALLLSAVQARALWIQVIADDDEGAGVLHRNALATAAQQAWQRLHDWNLEPAAQRARSGESSFQRFLAWAERYAARLRAEGWTDAAHLTSHVRVGVERRRLTLDDVVIAGRGADYPAVDRLLASMRDAGIGVTAWCPENVSRKVGRLALSDRREEIDAALTWASERIAARPSQRIAIVLPPDPGGDAILRRWFSSDDRSHDNQSVLPPSRRPSGGAGIADPVVGVALDCLRLLGSSSDFVTLSRVLRSPFVGDNGMERGRRAIAEAELRQLLAAQADFPSAFLHGGLAKRMRSTIPEFVDKLANVLEALHALPGRQTPTAWARFMDDALGQLGWHGAHDAACAPAIELWARATAEFCTLTAVIGKLTYEGALGELESLLLRTQQPIELPITGISIFASIDQVGPGYDAAWSIGMSDQAWPCMARVNSLLPLGLQRAHGMPFATPEATLAHCRQQTAELIARVPEVIFSYPQIVDDEPANPSALIRGFAEVEVTTRRCLSYPSCGLRGPRAPFDVRDDPVPPMTEEALPGGVQTLALQAECPLRAFIEGRLRARPLDRPQRGIGPRLRGVLAHRALELLYEALGSKAAALELSQRGELGALARTCVDRAFTSLLSAVGDSQRALGELERTRLEGLVTALVQRDLERDDFTVEALEIHEQIEIGGVRIRCRIDRIDCLADGRFAIIDYKTGRSVATGGLLAARLSDPQLPLYSLAVDKPLGALVYAALKPGNVAFRGIWDPAETFPGRPLKLPAGRDWSEQQAHWREQIAMLVDELVAGDGRVFLDAVKPLREHFATLARACEIESNSNEDVTGSQT